VLPLRRCRVFNKLKKTPRRAGKIAKTVDRYDRGFAKR
jgi:hypothetical protein